MRKDSRGPAKRVCDCTTWARQIVRHFEAGRHAGSLISGIFYLIWYVTDPEIIFISLFMRSVADIEFLSHYRRYCPEIRQTPKPYFRVYGADKITSVLKKITTSMAGWKLLLFRARILKERGNALLGDTTNRVPDIDRTTPVSFSSQREGAEAGMNRKYRGKPCFQLSASFIGRIFADGHLFPGNCNPKVFFKKAVKRVTALGLFFKSSDPTVLT